MFVDENSLIQKITGCRYFGPFLGDTVKVSKVSKVQRRWNDTFMSGVVVEYVGVLWLSLNTPEVSQTFTNTSVCIKWLNRASLKQSWL